MKKCISMILLILFLLYFHESAIVGATKGLLLWYQTLIPSLLPFILITNALSETNAYYAVTHLFNNTSPKIYELITIALGNLCGYPIGGKILNDFVENKYITPTRANQILSIASQASPMFLIGYVYTNILYKSIPLWLFLTSIYLPNLFLYMLKPYTPVNNDSFDYNTPKKVCICDTFLHAVQIMVIIGVYVMIFSIILEILTPICSSSLCQYVLSFLEITTGLKQITMLSASYCLKVAIVCMLSSFGGLCSAFQIHGVLNYRNANIKKYLIDKIILSIGTFLFAFCYMILKFTLH